MVREIKEDIKIIEVDGEFILDKHYQFGLTKEEIKEFGDNLKGVVSTCEEELKKHDEAHLKIVTEAVKQKVDKELESKKEALKNFSKYKTNTILEFKRKSKEKFDELVTFCNPEVFEKYKELCVEGTRKEFEASKENYKTQLKENKPLLEVYEKFNDDKKD